MPEQKQSLQEFKLVFGQGTISAVLSITLALLAVLSFYFPTYLTTPELRAVYTESFARGMLFGGIILSALFAVTNIILSKRVVVACISFVLLMFAVLLGGHAAPVGTLGESSIYFGLDFFILNLLLFAFIFIAIEKLFGRKKDQLIFRREWHTDLIYFTFNHILIGIFLIVVNSFVAQFEFALSVPVQSFIQSLHIVVQFFLVMLVADIVQYWSHRAYHEIPFLWKFHAVHHSSEVMDWIAGSRLHIVELLLTRSLIFLPLVLLGFDTLAVNAYVAFVAFQAVFDHANVSVNPSFLKYVFVTPNFHHWHHSQDREALDKNYASHFSFLDYLFGTAVDSQKMWPERYGVLGGYVPHGFLKQFIWPFRANRKDLTKKIVHLAQK